MPIILPRFPSVTSIKPMLTHDSDFVKVVDRLGGQISYSCSFDEKLEFHLQERFMFDLHPDIDGQLKILSD